ncbi:zona pellucida sperm-binding protein 3-like [Varanus komodoensis]|uniref:zona pellucida sperm-binding protein 3-like n=1 Tax=Varanus komodoensis TaxID=61221 RepID=UPI001CF785CA|nr:zona pellucida sperm-binding protein 3-like [Varanus komodoensis]
MTGLCRGLFAVLACSLTVPAAAQRVPATSVDYDCNGTSIHLVVKMDPWGAGVRLDPQYLFLGSCSPSFENDAKGLFHFQYRLKECGFARLASGRRVEHSAHLIYAPPSAQGRVHSRPFAERINCTDVRADHVPTQVSVTGHLSASSLLMFTVQLMNEDFSAPSHTKAFPLGSQIHIKFAVQSFFHQPLRVFVDECTAAATPELSKSPQNYSIVANHGCVVDGKVANTWFLPRRTPEVIHLSLQAFEFVGVDTDIYLHCQVLVWDPKVLSDPTRKACSFRRDVSRWEHLDDPTSSVCSCCDSVCQAAGSRHKRDSGGSPVGVSPLQSSVVIGRLTIRKSTRNGGQSAWDSNSNFAVKSHKGKVCKAKVHQRVQERESSSSSHHCLFRGCGGREEAVRGLQVPPAVGALVLEGAAVATLSLGFCLCSGYRRRRCLRSREAARPAPRGPPAAEQDRGGRSASADRAE